MEFINYKSFGKCAKLSKGGKTMLVTVESYFTAMTAAKTYFMKTNKTS